MVTKLSKRIEQRLSIILNDCPELKPPMKQLLLIAKIEGKLETRSECIKDIGRLQKKFKTVM